SKVWINCSRGRLDSVGHAICFSLTPAFRPVEPPPARTSRLNGFAPRSRTRTGLKAGVNQKISPLGGLRKKNKSQSRCRHALQRITNQPACRQSKKPGPDDSFDDGPFHSAETFHRAYAHDRCCDYMRG